MKKILLGLCIALSVVHYASAQKSPAKFGQIPLEDLKMTVYAKDSSAEAVVLLDYGDAAMRFYSADVKLVFERHVRIKILRKEGLKWADAAIQLYNGGSSEEKVTSFKASTYNLENGRVVETEVEKGSMFKEKFNKYINLQKFTFPNVKEGSVLEYSYTISSDYLFNFPNWQFQTKIPTRHSEFIAVIPNFCRFEKYMQGYVLASYDVKSINNPDYQAKSHHWMIKDVPAFKSEPFITCEDDFMAKVNFAISHIEFPGRPTIEIMGSWEKLCKVLNDAEDFGKVVSGNSFLKKEVDAVITGVPDEKAKVKAIYNYVKSAIEWNGVKDKYSESLKKALETKKGSSADINLMLASMLTKAGLSTDMILLSTRDHGFVRPQFPMEKQFNYAICRVKAGNEFLLLDATEKYLPMDILPDRCLNGEGLIVSKVNTGWVNLETRGKSRTVTSADLLLEASGNLKGKVNYNYNGYAASNTRRDYFKEGEQKYFTNTLAGKAWEVSASKFDNAKDIEKPAITTHEISIPSHASVAGSQIYINPVLAGETIENPFKADSREYPIDFVNPQEKIYMVKITIPTGYSIDELPQTKMFALPDNAGRFTYSVTVNENVISLVSNLQINKRLFLQTEYPILREFYNQIVAKHNEQVVLKKL